MYLRIHLLIGFGMLSIISAEDLAGTVDEGPCVSPFSPKVFPDLDEEWFKKSEANGWYIPFLSKIYAYSLTHLFTGKPPVSEDAFKKMCPSVTCTPAQTNFSAYDNFFLMKCVQGQIGSLKCTAPEKQILALLVAVWADNKNYALMNTCFGGVKKAWFLFSNLKTPVPHKIKTTVLNQIKAAGFSPQKTYALDYGLCKL